MDLFVYAPLPPIPQVQSEFLVYYLVPITGVKDLLCYLQVSRDNSDINLTLVYIRTSHIHIMNYGKEGALVEVRKGLCKFLFALSRANLRE